MKRKDAKTQKRKLLPGIAPYDITLIVDHLQQKDLYLGMKLEKDNERRCDLLKN